MCRWICFCVPGRMTCWTWRPCFRRIPGWVARSSSRVKWRGLSSPYLKSPGTSTWMDTSPHLTEKRWRRRSDSWKPPLKEQAFIYLSDARAKGGRKPLFDRELRRVKPLLAALFLNRQHFASFHGDFCHHGAHLDKYNIPCDSSHTHK